MLKLFKYLIDLKYIFGVRVILCITKKEVVVGSMCGSIFLIIFIVSTIRYSLKLFFSYFG